MYYVLITLVVIVVAIYMLRQKIESYINEFIKHAVKEIENQLSQKLKEELSSRTIIRGNYDKDLRTHLQSELWALQETLSGNFHKIAKKSGEDMELLYSEMMKWKGSEK